MIEFIVAVLKNSIIKIFATTCALIIVIPLTRFIFRKNDTYTVGEVRCTKQFRSIGFISLAFSGFLIFVSTLEDPASTTSDLSLFILSGCFLLAGILLLTYYYTTLITFDRESITQHLMFFTQRFSYDQIKSYSESTDRDGNKRYILYFEKGTIALDSDVLIGSEELFAYAMTRYRHLHNGASIPYTSKK